MSGFDPAGLSRIEDAGLNASAPPQQLWLDGWLLRLCPGKAKRARCINALAAGHLRLDERLAQATARYHQAGLPLVLRCTPFSQPRTWDADLDALGLQAFDDTCVMVAPVSQLRLRDAPLICAPTGALPGAPTVASPDRATAPRPASETALQLSAASADDFAAAVGQLRGTPAEQQGAHAERLMQSPVPYRGWLLHQGGTLLACGQYAREAEHVGLYDVFTAPAARNQGLARRLCAELLRRAVAEGAQVAYLQVDAANEPARAVYRRLGFVDGYRYHYRSADPGAAS